MKLPRISVVTVSFNSAAFIERTIRSVLNCGYPDLEYIVIDGGSTDGTQDIIRKYESGISYWVSEKDAGQYDAINKGFRKSHGEVMAFLNADDIYLPWTLNTVGSIFGSVDEIQWLTSLQVSTVDSHGTIFSNGTLRPIATEGFRRGLYIPGNSDFGCIVQEGTFWRRGLWDKSGAMIDTSYPLAGDFDLWTKFSERTNVYCLGQPLAAMTRHAGQRSNNMEKYQAECRQSLRSSWSRREGREWREDKGWLRWARSKQLVWPLARRLSGLTAMVVDPLFAEPDYLTRWSTRQIRIY